MAKLELDAALGVAGLACFQLVTMWSANAPKLPDVRAAQPFSADFELVRNQMLDASVLVGGMAVIAGTALAIMAKDLTVLILLMVTFGFVSLWYRGVLYAHPAHIQ